MKSNLLIILLLTLSSHVFASELDSFLGTYVVTEQTCLLNAKTDYGCPPLSQVKVAVEDGTLVLYELQADGTSLKRSLDKAQGDANSLSWHTPRNAVSLVRLSKGGVSYVYSERHKHKRFKRARVYTRGYTLYPR